MAGMRAERANSASQAIGRASYLVGPSLMGYLLELLSLLPLLMAVAACYLLGTLGVLLNPALEGMDDAPPGEPVPTGKHKDFVKKYERSWRSPRIAKARAMS
jgi:hypothetical protein